MSTETTDTEPITETITQSNIGDIVETLYNSDDDLIGYACKQVLEKNTVEPMDLIFYMDVLTPKAEEGSVFTADPQAAAVEASQEVLLREMSQEFQIDPGVSRGIRCFDLPVDGSTWIVKMTIDPKEFQEVTLFGGCRELEWDPEKQDCKFYEARMKGAYIGAVSTGQDGTPFGDAVSALEELINGDEIASAINTKMGGGILGWSDYDTAFLGVPRVPDDPNFQGGKDQARENLNEPTNIKTGIDSNMYARPNRNTITVVGGLLVACFSIAFAMVGYIFFKRRRSYRRKQAQESDLDDHDGEGVEAGLHYEFDKGNNDGTDDDAEDEGDHMYARQQHPQEYPNLPMSAEAIQMDLGNALKGQMMGRQYPAPVHHGRSTGLYNPDGSEPSVDDTDSWAQTDGTIGSLELQLEPITAEV